MNDKWSDQILDSLMEEVVTGVHPPDMTQRIEQAWKKECGQTPATNGTPKLIVAKAIAAPQSDAPRAEVASAIRVETAARNMRKSSWHLPAFGIAASILLLAASLQYWHVTSQELASQKTAPEAGYTVPEVAPDQPNVGRQIGSTLASKPDKSTSELNNKTGSNATASPAIASQDKSVSGSNAIASQDKSVSGSKPNADQELLPLEVLPFGPGTELVKDQAKTQAQEPMPAKKLGRSRLDEAQIVELIDSQMRVLWSSQNVTPAAALESEQLVRKSYVRLTGTEPGLARIAQHLEGGELPNRMGMVESLATSPEFAIHWSNVFVRRMLAGTEAANAKSKSGQVLRDSLAQAVLQRSAWNSVMAGLLDSSTLALKHENSDSEIDQLFLGSLAGSGNHRLAARIGVGMLDRAIACARCHDSQSAGNEPAMGQSNYWSLVAVLMGLEPGANIGQLGPSLVDKQLELLASKKANPFFELPDGRMQRAEAVLPDGRPWNSMGDARSPRSALARWLEESTEVDRAIVNQAWRVVFGRPLVPAIPVLDDLGLSERFELLSLLGSQLRAYNHDVGKLVGWLASSEAFTLGPTEMNRQKWLLASDDEKTNWSKAELAFAATGFLGTAPESATLASSVAAVVNWNALERQQEQRSLLAQPDNSVKPLKSKSKPATNKIEGPSMSYLLHLSGSGDSGARYVDRLLKSKLSWKEQVQHVVGLTGDYSVSRQVETMADQLHKEVAGGPREALLKLLWAVRNHDAS